MDNNLTPKDIRELERKFNLIPDHFTPYYFEGRLDAIARLTNKKERVLKHGKGKCPPDKGWVQPKGRKGFCRTLPEVKALQQASLKMGEGQPMTRPKSQFPTGLIIGGAGGLALGAAIALTLSGSKSRDDVSKEAYESVQQDLDKERIKARDAQARRKEIEEKMAENEAERINLENEKAKAQATAKTLEKQLKDLKAKQQKAKEAQESATTSDEVDELKKTHAKEKQDIENKVKSGEKKINQLETELNTHKGRVSSLEEQLAEKLKNHERLVTLKETLAEAVGFKAPTTVPIENVTKRVKEQLGEIDKLTQERDKAIAEKDKLVEEMKKSSEKEGEIEQEIKNAEGELAEETQNLTDLEQEIEKLKEDKKTVENAKSGLEENLNTIKQTLKNANISEDILNAEKINPEELQRELAKLSTPPQVTTNIEQGDYDKAIAELTTLKEAQLAIARKLFPVRKKEGETDEDAVKRKIKETVGLNQSDEVDVADELQMAISQLSKDNLAYESLNKNLEELALVHLGQEVSIRKGTKANEILDKLKAKLASSPDSDELKNLQNIQQQYNQLAQSLTKAANDLKLNEDQTTTKLTSVIELAKQAQGLQTKLDQVQLQLTESEKNYNLLKSSNETVKNNTAQLQTEIESLKRTQTVNNNTIKAQAEAIAQRNKKIKEINENITALEGEENLKAIHAQAIKELTDDYEGRLAQLSRQIRADYTNLEVKLLGGFDQQVVKKSEEEQRRMKLNGDLLINPEQGVSLLASRDWKSNFFESLNNVEREEKVKEACERIGASMYSMIQSGLQKRALDDLKFKTDEVSNNTLRFFTPLTDELQRYNSSDLTELHNMYSAIQKGFKPKTVEELNESSGDPNSVPFVNPSNNAEKFALESDELYKLIRSRTRANFEEGGRQLKEKMTEQGKLLDNAYAQLARVEYTHQVLSLREKALSLAQGQLVNSYTQAHRDLLSNVDLENIEDLRTFDDQSAKLTQELWKQMKQVESNLYDKERLEKAVANAGEFSEFTGFIVEEGRIGFNLGGYDLETEQGRQAQAKEEARYKQFKFFEQLTGLNPTEIAKLFPSMIASSNQKKNK